MGDYPIIAIVALIAVAIFVLYAIVKIRDIRRKDWTRHPRYLADAGGLFGAAPRLKCVGGECDKTTHELFYGHCKECAIKEGIPMQGVPPEAFHEAIETGTTTVHGKC